MDAYVFAYHSFQELSYNMRIFIYLYIRLYSMFTTNNNNLQEFTVQNTTV